MKIELHFWNTTCSGKKSRYAEGMKEGLFPAFFLFPSSPAHFPSGSLCAEERGGEL